MNSANLNKGFTLVELLVTMAILGIFAAVAAPSFNTLINKNKVSTVSSELASLFQFARSLAAQKNASVAVCLDSGTWSVHSPGAGADSCGQSPLREMSPDAVVTITPGGNPLPIIFNSNGTVTAASSYTVCIDQVAANGFLITVLASGTIRVWPRGTDQNGNAFTSC